MAVPTASGLIVVVALQVVGCDSCCGTGSVFDGALRWTVYERGYLGCTLETDRPLEQAGCPSVYLRYPKFRGARSMTGRAAERINSWVEDGILAAFQLDGPSPGDYDEATRRFFQEYERVRERLGWKPGFGLHSEVDILSDNTRLISLRIFNSVYKGTAHVHAFDKVATFDKNSGERLGPMSFLEPNRGGGCQVSASVRTGKFLAHTGGLARTRTSKLTGMDDTADNRERSLRSTIETI